MFKAIITTNTNINKSKPQIPKAIYRNIQAKSFIIKSAENHQLQEQIHLYRNMSSQGLFNKSPLSFDFTKNNNNSNIFPQIQPWLVQSQTLLLLNLNQTKKQSVLKIIQKTKILYHRIVDKNTDQSIISKRQSNSQDHQKQNFKFCDIILILNNIDSAEKLHKYLVYQEKIVTLFLKNVLFISINANQELKELRELIQNQNYIQSQEINKKKSNKEGQKDVLNRISVNQKWIELPTCITCLSKIQYSVTGIDLSIYQQNNNGKGIKIDSPTKSQSFISNQDNMCCKTCKIIKVKHEKQKITCPICSQQNDNWVCMVCGQVRCGRYKQGDAQKHFLESGHIVSMDLQTQSIWNYLKDCFSHRLLSASRSQLKFPGKNNFTNQSIEAAFWQYCSVVSQELDHQRQFYQNMEKQELSKFVIQNQKIENMIEQLEKDNQEKQMQFKKVNKKKKKVEKRALQLKQKCDEQRYTLKDYEQMLKNNTYKESEQIAKKQKILDNLEQQISKVLIKLTE